MALSRQIIEDIQSFAIDNDSALGMSILKQPTMSHAAHLMISLGGSGADMLREVKGLINLNHCADHDKHMPPERVAYLAFDSDRTQRDRNSGKATGQVKLTDDELTILSGGMLRTIFDPSIREFNKATYPWIYRWLDTGIPLLPEEGSLHRSGIRQVGRVMLFLEIEKVVDKIRTAITNLITGTNVESLNVYILSGVSGKTGSGTFLDMAYIVRQVANEVIGAGTFKKTNIRILGYLIMPDVNLLNADSKTRPVVLRNAGAALQELDHAMKLQEIGDYYECQYSNTMTVKTDKRPFDYVHLISAKPKGASMPDNPYQHCLDTVAGSIRCFVSGQKKIDSYYSIITKMHTVAKATSTYKERSNCYISVGYDCWEIPADRVIKNIFTRLFSTVGELVENEPTQDDAWNIFTELGLGYDRIIESLLENMTPPLDPTQYTNKQLFGKGALDLSEHLPFSDMQEEINKRYLSYCNSFESRCGKALQRTFIDTARGPFWTGHVMISGVSDGIDALDKLIIGEKHRAEAYRAAVLVNADACLQDIKRMPAFYRLIASDKKRREYIDAWNRYFRTELEVYCLDILLGTGNTLKSIDSNLTGGLYDFALNKAAELNNYRLDVTQQILVELRDVVQRNTDEFQKASVRETGHGFDWNTGEIPNLDKAISDIISMHGISQTQIMHDFLKLIFSKTEEQTQSLDIRKIIEEFLEQQAHSVLNVPLERLLSINFDKSGTLEKSVEYSLMPYMRERAEPFSYGDRNNDYHCFWRFPVNCMQIENGIKKYAGRHGHTYYKWNLPYRISLICIAKELPLYDYPLTEECERQISLDSNARGLFLNQGSDSFPGAVNNMKNRLPSLIPSRMRTAENPAPESIAEFERKLIVEFREMREGKYPFLKFEKTCNQQDYNLYINLSVGLDQSGFYNMIREDKYRNNKEEPDADKLRDLIKKLKEIRYNTGLPETGGFPRRLVVCENLLSAATQEMKDRYHDVHPDQEEKIKEEVAWEVAEWFYTSSYSIYMRAQKEKAKYDEIGEKIEELEKLESQVSKPAYCAAMARMLAAGVIMYNSGRRCFDYESSKGIEPFLAIDLELTKVKEMVLFEELEEMRIGNSADRKCYKELEERTFNNYEEVLDTAYRKAFDERGADGKYPADSENIRVMIGLYKKLVKVRDEAVVRKRKILEALAADPTRITGTENDKTRKFYVMYADAVESEMCEGVMASRMTMLGIVKQTGELLPEKEIFSAS